MNEWNLSDKLERRPFKGYPEEDVKEFIDTLKERMKLAVNSDKRTKAQWIYKNILNRIYYEIDKLAGEDLK